MRRLPAYRIHKTKNLAYVSLKGRMHYLGRAHSPESWRAYHAAIAVHLAGKPPERPARSRQALAAFTIAELAERWYLAEQERFGPRHQRTYEAGYASKELIRQHATASIH